MIVGSVFVLLNIHICCAIMAIPEAWVARLTRGIVKISMKRVKKLSDCESPASIFN